MRIRSFAGLFAMSTMLATPMLSAADRSWHAGTMLSSERQEKNVTVKDSDKKYSTDDNGNGHESTNTTTSNVTTAVYLIFTITDGVRTYEARQGTTVWQTKLKTAPGDKIQFAVDGDSLYVQREDGKEVKMKVLKVSVSPPPSPAQR